MLGPLRSGFLQVAEEPLSFIPSSNILHRRFFNSLDYYLHVFRDSLESLRLFLNLRKYPCRIPRGLFELFERLLDLGELFLDDSKVSQKALKGTHHNLHEERQEECEARQSHEPLSQSKLEFW